MSDHTITWTVDVERTETITETVTVDESDLLDWLDGSELTPALAREFLDAGDRREFPPGVRQLLQRGDAALIAVRLEGHPTSGAGL